MKSAKVKGVFIDSCHAFTDAAKELSPLTLAASDGGKEGSQYASLVATKALSRLILRDQTLKTGESLYGFVKSEMEKADDKTRLELNEQGKALPPLTFKENLDYEWKGEGFTLVNAKNQPVSLCDEEVLSHLSQEGDFPAIKWLKYGKIRSYFPGATFGKLLLLSEWSNAAQRFESRFYSIRGKGPITSNAILKCRADGKWEITQPSECNQGVWIDIPKCEKSTPPTNKFWTAQPNTEVWKAECAEMKKEYEAVTKAGIVMSSKAYNH